ncbi:MAG TPA: ATP-binding protein, partial [Roseiflexaceae bacterium]|nr:ATP-binding protein [Roseiflexaceae bacterium]
LVGAPTIDRRLHTLVDHLEAEPLLPAGQQVCARQVAAWAASAAGMPLLALVGADRATRRAVAAAGGDLLGRPVYELRAADLPGGADERETLVRIWEREAALSGSVLLLTLADPAEEATAMAFAEQVQGMLMLAADHAPPAGRRSQRRIDIPPATHAEQAALWHGMLGTHADVTNERIDQLTAQFTFGPREIRGVVQAAQRVADGNGALDAALWQACRSVARLRLDGLAQRIDSCVGWDDLVLPEAQHATLRQIAAHVRRRSQVYDTWGFAARGERGLGIGALFAGPSGTGKTLAAEVLANELQLDLFRIDLSAVVSKYIGETEKNLRRIFDAAEAGGAILLFDEADALFGKRSDVKDSHDRYANIEVSYLLQRMESYRGLAILTSNLKGNIDAAFLRRIRFVVNFPFPDANQRAAIWRRIFPPPTPIDGLDADILARLNIAGGNIRAIALNAAFLAADAGEPVRMAHLLAAARSEYQKIEKPLTDAELRGWPC